MKSSTVQSWIAIAVILAVGAGIAWAGSQGSRSVGGFPLFAWTGVLAFVVNWIVFVPSYAARTEHYFDLTGSLTYLSVVGFALLFGAGDARALLLAMLIGVWAARLGSFLFLRVKTDGSDGRFDRLKHDFPRFLMTWTLQGLWVFLTAGCALAALSVATPTPLGASAALGVALWLAGFAIEVTADRQKRIFRSDPANQGRFITTGLWAWSRHPNYFGEILLWVGIALIAAPALRGWQLVTLISPVFVYVLLSRISGVPLLEQRAEKRWGQDPEYVSYRDRTPALWLRPPRAA
ncbi:MAG: DUF1295 domain-containing protein [Myxococcota bacterium]